ncbi:hypothetical protein GM556_06515 [Bombella sp. ESL0378]|uniref:P-loop NTPase fold protein n=1 Tax=Bombella sp. ESL0378 TaxID=2676442 RepID=UPI0012D9C722|nr:P-loop NTPase fold protein [Bombella sp. ESL0378]MUG05195.1 hypothetical protein [Bombella sp. ESL0378]
MTKNYEWAGPNANVAEVLNKYCYGSSKPPFALMLNGPWGCGKTWLVKRLFDKKRTDRESDSELNMIYVSLYGMQNAEEITQAIYVAMHPILGGKIGELGKTVFKGLLKSTLKIDLYHLDDNKTDLSVILGMSGETKSKDKIFKKRILVLDDVERAKMPVSDILALVQPLVESHENRVILVANEKEIATDDNEERKRYERTKEKTVYLTLRVQPDIKSTWKDVIESEFKKDLKKSEDKDNFGKFLLENENNFIDFFEKTNVENIRILQLFLSSGKYLFPSFKGKQEDNNNIIFDILCLLYVLLIEKNIHGRTYDDIEKIVGPISKEDVNNDSYSKTRESNYFNLLKVYRMLNESIYYLLEKGILNKEDFEDNLSYFIHNRTTPIWKRISAFIYEKPSDTHYDSLIGKFRSYLEKETAENDKELLHVCDVYFMLKNMKINSFNDIDSATLLEKYTKRYCDSLLSKEIASLTQNDIWNVKDYFWEFHKENISKIKKINDILSCKKKKYLLKKIKDYFEEKIKNNQPFEITNLFLQRRFPTDDNPFLHNIDPDKFLECIDQLPTGSEQNKIFRELYFRFQEAKNKEWQNEKEWFETIIQKLREKADDATTHPFIKRLTELHLKTLEEGPRKPLTD